MSTSVCLSVREHISRTTRACAYCLLPLLSPPAGWHNLEGKKGAILGVFFPIDNALYGLFQYHSQSKLKEEQDAAIFTTVTYTAE